MGAVCWVGRRQTVDLNTSGLQSDSVMRGNHCCVLNETLRSVGTAPTLRQQRYRLHHLHSVRGSRWCPGSARSAANSGTGYTTCTPSGVLAGVLVLRVL
ncbi:unnamed protein product [Lota lota]